MFGNDLDLDLSQAKESGGFEPLPAGTYLVRCTDAAVKATKSGDGQYIATTLEVLEGEYEGRKLFTNFNIKNKSAQAVEIGMGSLRKFARCSGFDPQKKLTSTNTMTAFVTLAVVKIDHDTKFGDRNVVVDFKEPDPNAMKSQKVAAAALGFSL